MNRRGFIGLGALAGAGAMMSGFSLFKENPELILCISGIRKSDAFALGWMMNDSGRFEGMNAETGSGLKKILPLRESQSLIFSQKNNHLDKLEGMFAHLGLDGAATLSKGMRERCFDEPVLTKAGQKELIYFDGLEAGHYSRAQYFEALEKSEKIVRSALSKHFLRYGENAHYVICSEIGRDEQAGEDGEGLHHNHFQSGYGFVSRSRV